MIWLLSALCLSIPGGVALGWLVSEVYLRTRPLPYRASEDDLMRHSIEQDAKWRERLMQ